MVIHMMEGLKKNLRLVLLNNKFIRSINLLFKNNFIKI